MPRLIRSEAEDELVGVAGKLLVEVLVEVSVELLSGGVGLGVEEGGAVVDELFVGLN